MRISDWSSDVCSSDLFGALPVRDQLRALADMAKEFSGYAGYDQIADGIDAIAADIATEERWEGDELATRYLEPALQMSFQRVRSEERRVGNEGVSRCRSRW